jgi:tetratricopeptide (TPR) repeat protein
MPRSMFTLAAATILPAAMLGFTGTAAAEDSVVIEDNFPRVSGTVKRMTATEVSVETGGSLQKIAVTHIEAIEYEGEPAELKSARAALKAGNDQEAITLLDKIDPLQITKKPIKQDLAFYRAQALARMALGAGGDIKQAGTAVYEFTAANPDSYHYLPAQELVGDLLVADGNPAAALKAYAELARVPINEFKMRAGVGSGRAYLAQKKVPEAQAEFEKVLAFPLNPAWKEIRAAAEAGIEQCRAGAAGSN